MMRHEEALWLQAKQEGLADHDAHLLARQKYYYVTCVTEKSKLATYFTRHRCGSRLLQVTGF